MEREISLQDAVQALKEQYGERVDAGQDEGRDMMAETLQNALGVSAGRAKEIVRDLEEAHSIRWVAQTEQGEEAGPAVVVPGMFDHDTSRVVASVPVRGYWQL